MDLKKPSHKNLVVSYIIYNVHIFCFVMNHMVTNVDSVIHYIICKYFFGEVARTPAVKLRIYFDNDVNHIMDLLYFVIFILLYKYYTYEVAQGIHWMK